MVDFNKNILPSDFKPVKCNNVFVTYSDLNLFVSFIEIFNSLKKMGSCVLTSHTSIKNFSFYKFMNIRSVRAESI